MLVVAISNDVPIAVVSLDGATIGYRRDQAAAAPRTTEPRREHRPAP